MRFIYIWHIISQTIISTKCIFNKRIGWGKKHEHDALFSICLSTVNLHLDVILFTQVHQLNIFTNYSTHCFIIASYHHILCTSCTILLGQFIYLEMFCKFVAIITKFHNFQSKKGESKFFLNLFPFLLMYFTLLFVFWLI